jgi:signal transduction histidine kinase/CheY-like chemotaxis protein
MRYIFLLFTLFFVYTSLNAAQYIRSIRVASYSNENVAKEAMINVEKFLYNHENFLKLQQENKFELKIIPSGKYYLLVVEPFTNRQIMQTILDIVRKRYKRAYPKKLHSYDFTQLKKYKNKLEPLRHTKPIIVKPVSQAKIKVQIQPVVKKIRMQVEKQNPVKIKVQEVQTIKQNKQHSKWYEKYSTVVFLYIILALLIIFMMLFIFYVIKAIKLKNRNAILQRVVEHTQEELHAKERLMAHVSHELRTPMNAIAGLSHIMLENDLPVFQKENAQNIKNSANNAIDIVNDILDVSKINSGAMKIENVEFNINDVLEHVLSTVYIQAKNNNVSLLLDVDDNVPAHIISDSLRLGQVLINLLSNAIKFSKNGTVTLKITKKDTFVDSVHLKFNVSDTGIGMTKEQMNKIFSSYVQADASTSREYGGTGLGLVISKELIEGMGGRIKVHSQKLVGSTFAFTISAKVNDIENKRNYRLPSDDMLNKKILIVDSTNENVIALLRAFRYFKYQTHVIPSLTDNVIDGKINFDIIVINQMELSSDAIMKLQKMHFTNRTKTKIILTSKRYSVLDKEVLKELEISGFLKIPFTQQSVLNVVSEMYEMKKIKNISQTNIIKEKLNEMSGKKILVADDNVLNHKVVAGLLSKTGIDITFVINGQDVVDLLKKGMDFDLILMDIEMPIVDGYNATSEIRKDATGNHIPILALSANVTEEAIDKAFSIGMQGYISKPIIIDDFYKKIYDALSYDIKLNANINMKDNDEGLAELSVVMGLGRCNNDTEFYKSILNDFTKMYVDSASTIKIFCKNSNFKEAKRIVIDIKDVALNIGAYKLFENLDTLSHEIEYGEKGNWEEVLVEYNILLKKLIKEIGIYIDEK